MIAGNRLPLDGGATNKSPTFIFWGEKKMAWRPQKEVMTGEYRKGVHEECSAVELQGRMNEQQNQYDPT